MFKAVGCLVVVIAAAVGGWFLKGKWDRVRGAAADSAAVWAAPSREGAQRAAGRISSLGRAGAPAFVALSAEEFAAHVFTSEAGRLPPSSHDVTALVAGDRMLLRAKVRPSELGESSVLGPMASILGDTVELRMAGTFHVVREGLAEFKVLQVRAGDLVVPGPLIPSLIRRFGDAGRPAGLSDNGVGFAIPPQVADIRIASGKILVYRSER